MILHSKLTSWQLIGHSVVITCFACWWGLDFVSNSLASSLIKMTLHNIPKVGYKMSRDYTTSVLSAITCSSILFSLILPRAPVLQRERRADV
jgi:hypothetical protein